MLSLLVASTISRSIPFKWSTQPEPEMGSEPVRSPEASRGELRTSVSGSQALLPH